MEWESPSASFVLLSMPMSYLGRQKDDKSYAKTKPTVTERVIVRGVFRIRENQENWKI
jgi:hypothetical protein